MKLYDCEGIGRYIAHIHRLCGMQLSKEYKKLNIGVGQYQYLIQLYLNDGISHEELTEKMSVDKASTTRAIAKLFEQGYVDITSNQKDKRKYLIHLTKLAMEKKDEILGISYRWEQDLISPLTNDEKDMLFLLLRKIARNNKGYFYKEIEKGMDIKE